MKTYLTHIINALWRLLTGYDTGHGTRLSAVVDQAVFVNPNHGTAGCGRSSRSLESRSTVPALKRTVINWSSIIITSLALLLPTYAVAETPGGTRISNTAEVNFNANATYRSNTTLTMVRSDADLDTLRYAPDVPTAESFELTASEYSASASDSGPFTPMDGVLDALGNPLQLIEDDIFAAGSVVFFRLRDLDQNLDPAQIESVFLTVTVAASGDQEYIRIYETGLDTGIFVGYLPSDNNPATGVWGDGLLQAPSNSTINVNYIDIADGDDTSIGSALFDPLGRVFDSVTGALLDGVEVTLIDASTDQPAMVFGNGFDSSGQPCEYPATISTGSNVLDSCGVSYQMIPGGYQFPRVSPGNYRIDVSAPAGYSAPSSVPFNQLQSLPNGPWDLNDPASLGGEFLVNPGPAFRADIPLDPNSGVFWLSKDAGRDNVSIGDFLSYTLTLENNEDALVPDITLSDTLPLGFRYQKGSTQLNENKAANPQISDDGRTLTFALGDIPAQTNTHISYVVEVAVGAETGDAVNRAIATASSGIQSNMATARVSVREDFFRDQSLIMGRVMTGGCERPDTELKGLQNSRIYLEDGTFVITDQNGKYHFEGVEPGTHVVQLDLTSLPATYEAISCEENTLFAGRNFSQFVDIQGGTMWRADFHVDLKAKQRGEVDIELNGALDGDIATFQVPIHISQIPLSNLRLNVLMPMGFEYISGSSNLNELVTPDPDTNEQTLTYSLGDRPAGWEGIVTLRVKATDAVAEELPTRATLTFNTPDQQDQQTPMVDNLIKVKEQPTPVTDMKFDVRPNYPTRVATLSPEDKIFFDQLAEQLKTFEIDKLFAIGHTDNVRIAPENRIYFADNFALSSARANNVAVYLGTALNLPPEKIVSIGIADATPVADNSTPEGRSLNRRVEIRIEGKKIDRKRILDMVKAHSGLQSVETIGLRPGETNTMETTEEQGSPEEQLSSTEGILYPADGETLSNRIVSVRIELDANLKPRLTLDGKEIPEDRIGFKLANNETDRTIYTYIGVDMGDKGTHQLKLEGLGPFGNARYQQEIEVVRTGEIADIRVLEVDGNVADGITPVTIRLQLLDSNGQIINGSTTLSVFEGTLTPQLNDLGYDDPTRDDSHVLVDAQGYVHFQPIQSSGLYHTTLGYNNKTIRIETYVKPVMRDWILVGFAEGTLGHNNLSGNQVGLEEAGIEDHSYSDSRVKFFAKGAIKGKWLLTMAYDSDKKNRDAESLQQIINPDTYYPLYGDETLQGYEASSARKIYVKLERDQFYALFGDMQTGLTKTDLSRYSRTMNGFKSEMQGKNFEYNIFAADTRQGFMKDEIRGDGTSGRYYLSQQDLVINSETIVIETRDRFHSEEIISSQSLQRYLDYDIDYDKGSIFFKRPIASKDENFNPIFIVVRYETRVSDNSKMNYGGRAAVNALNHKVEVGATLVHEETGTGEGDLYGVDATIRINRKNSLRLEAATTDTKDVAADGEGSAYLAEFEHNSKRLHASAYYREQDKDFGLGQQNNSEYGTRKYGAEGSYRISQKTSVSALAYHEDNLATDADRDVAQLEANYKKERFSLHGGLRDATDTLGDGSKKESQQLLAGADWISANGKLTLRGTHEQSLGNKDENTNYPTVTRFGADYRLSTKVSLFAEQEFSWGDGKETEGTRAGLKATPWRGGDAQTAVERQSDENSERIFALFGLGQTWQISKNWSADASLDRSYTIKDSGDYTFNTNVPPAYGSNEDFTAVSLGTTYQHERWSWTNRLELHHTDSEDRYGMTSGLIGQIHRGVSASARYIGFLTDGSDDYKNSSQELTLGLAYRPLNSRWIFLNRLDAEFDRDENSWYDDKTWRLINNLHANFKINRDWQIAPYYGLKYVKENFSGTHYDGFTDLAALETRYNLNERWDLGLHGSVLHSWNSDQIDFSSGASVGYLFMKNLWASVGYNYAGFRDDDFSQSNYTAKGVFLKFRLKFDQNTASEALEWMNRQ